MGENTEKTNKEKIYSIFRKKHVKNLEKIYQETYKETMLRQNMNENNDDFEDETETGGFKEPEWMKIIERELMKQKIKSKVQKGSLKVQFSTKNEPITFLGH